MLQRPAAARLHTSPAAAAGRVEAAPAEQTQTGQTPPASEDPTRRKSPDRLYARIELELRTHDVAVMNSYTTFLKMAARYLDIEVGKVYDPPRHFLRQSLLKSVHIFGKHFVQYETRTMFRVLELHRLTGSTADTYLEYIQRMLPEGIAMKVTRHARERLPDHLTSIPEAARDEPVPAPEDGTPDRRA